MRWPYCHTHDALKRPLLGASPSAQAALVVAAPAAPSAHTAIQRSASWLLPLPPAVCTIQPLPLPPLLEAMVDWMLSVLLPLPLEEGLRYRRGAW